MSKAVITLSSIYTMLSIAPYLSSPFSHSTLSSLQGMHYPPLYMS